jgi:acyl carrier protein
MKTNKTNPERAEIIERMRNILEPWVSDAALIDKISEKTNLITDLGLDSIGILQMILGVEKEFGISIETSELDSETFSIMGNLLEIIEKKLYENN